MHSARGISNCWSDKIGASGDTCETTWRRRDLGRAEEMQDRIACAKVCGASEHNRQDVSASGLSHEG